MRSARASSSRIRVAVSQMALCRRKPFGLLECARQTAESDRLGLIDQVVEPILSIVRELLGCAIGGILLEQNRESAERTIANGMSVGEPL